MSVQSPGNGERVREVELYKHGNCIDQVKASTLQLSTSRRKVFTEKGNNVWEQGGFVAKEIKTADQVRSIFSYKWQQYGNND